MRAAITASMSRGDPDAAAKALFCHLPWSLFPASARSLALAFANEFFKLAHYRRLPCLVMISHYPHALYKTALREWRTFTFQAITRGGKKAREQVWCNYPKPQELHDARFVGGEKRERERI